MLVEGNDDRGINVALQTNEDYAFDALRTQIFDLFAPQPADLQPRLPRVPHS